MRKVLIVYSGKFKNAHSILDKGWRLTLEDIKRVREYQEKKLCEKS